MTMLVGFLMLSIFTPFANAIELQRPSNPSCTDTAACDGQARSYFGQILWLTEGLQTSTNAGEICYQLSQVNSRYEDLKRVDFSLLSVPVRNQTTAFYYLFAIGKINAPAQSFCGLQRSQDRNGDFDYIRAAMRNLVRDASDGLKEITP